MAKPGFLYFALFVFLAVFGLLAWTNLASGDLTQMVFFSVFAFFFLGILYLIFRYSFALSKKLKGTEGPYDEEYNELTPHLLPLLRENWRKKKAVKTAIFRVLCDAVFQEYSFDENAGISQNEALFTKWQGKVRKFNSYARVDLIRSNFSCALSLVEYEIQKSKEVKKTQAILVVMDFRKTFQGAYYLMPDIFELGGSNVLSRQMQKGIAAMVESATGYREIRLEDQRFEEYYMVFGKDDVETRFILAPSLMDKLADLAERIGLTPHIGFLDNKMYLQLDQFEMMRWNLETSKAYYRRVHIFLKELEHLANWMEQTKGIWRA